MELGIGFGLMVNLIKVGIINNSDAGKGFS
jgi:hypothetical protein